MRRRPVRPRFTIAMIAAGLILATQAAAQVTPYEGEEFRGASFRVDTTMARAACTEFCFSRRIQRTAAYKVHRSPAIDLDRVFGVTTFELG